MRDAPGRGVGPPEVFASFLAAITFLAILAPSSRVVPGWARLAGVALVLAGIGLHTWAWRTLRRAGTSVDTLAVPGVLVSTGPYARCRNPMYLAGVVILSGWALATACLAGIALGPAFGGLARVRWIAAEERLLAAEIAEEWSSYAHRVRRWL